MVDISNEMEYLNILKYVFENGKVVPNRTGIDTASVFGAMCRYDLKKGFPLLTTKKVYWKGIVHELLWFLSGDTNIKYLNDNGVHIWDGNAKDHYEKLSKKKDWTLETFGNGIAYDEPIEGDLGPVYGYQWRNFNGQKIEQIKNVIENIKKVKEDPSHPSARRLIVTAWNPAQIHKMALPPCHRDIQFNVFDGKLNAKFEQRSCDLFLGVPFNIASYALLVHMVAYICDLEVGELVHSMGDVHIYLNHFDQVREQLSREPRKPPEIKLRSGIKDIFDFKYEDIWLLGYDPHPTIKGEMAV